MTKETTSQQVSRVCWPLDKAASVPRRAHPDPLAKRVLACNCVAAVPTLLHSALSHLCSNAHWMTDDSTPVSVVIKYKYQPQQ